MRSLITNQFALAPVVLPTDQEFEFVSLRETVEGTGSTVSCPNTGVSTRFNSKLQHPGIIDPRAHSSRAKTSVTGPWGSDGHSILHFIYTNCMSEVLKEIWINVKHLPRHSLAMKLWQAVSLSVRCISLICGLGERCWQSDWMVIVLIPPAHTLNPRLRSTAKCSCTPICLVFNFLLSKSKCK